MDHVAEVSAAAAQPMEEDEEEEEDKEADVGDSSSTEDQAPQQAVAPWATMPAALEFWALGPSE